MTYIKELVKLLPPPLQKRLPKTVSLITITSRESRRINRTYRKKDRATNVLSFYYDHSYGEILICPEVIRREAREQKNPYQYQYAWMIIHGVLHCAGMHHEKSKTLAKKVELLEQKILLRIDSSLRSVN